MKSNTTSLRAWFRTGAAALLLGLVASCSSDQAVTLSNEIGDAATGLRELVDGKQATVTFAPCCDATGSYALVFLPGPDTKRDELVAAGLAQDVAADVYDTLEYVDVGTRPLLVVHRGKGDMSFTGHWTRFASVEEVLVFAGREACEVVLEKVEGEVRIMAIR